jgi:hypothetical protein
LGAILTDKTDLGGPNLVVDINLLDYFASLLSFKRDVRWVE